MLFARNPSDEMICVLINRSVDKAAKWMIARGDKYVWPSDGMNHAAVARMLNLLEVPAEHGIISAN